MKLVLEVSKRLCHHLIMYNVDYKGKEKGKLGMLS